MNFKKRVNGSWVDTPNYIHNTSTDTLTTLPADIYANDTTATVGLKGNTMQSGTPTPDNPIQPQECGERTGNLFDKDRTQGIIANAYVNQSGQQTTSQNYYLSYPFYVSEGDVYTWSFNSTTAANHSAPTVAFYDNTDNLIGVATHTNSIYHFTFTVPSNVAYMRASVYVSGNNDTGMLLVGSVRERDQVPLAFIPYGYKIPIPSANTTTNVYLGKVESTRKIKKLVLTGEENVELQSTNVHGIANFWFYNLLSGIEQNNQTVAISSHFVQTYTPIADVTSPCFSVSTSSQSLYLKVNASDIPTVTAMTTYLQQQYANGTPVTVWYTLATPETAVVNEPLRKIGDYADEVSGITIPTIAGANAADVLTTLKPSEVSVTYHGWHPVQSVHERENGAWT